MRYVWPMYIESFPNRGSPPAILLRESYRQDGKVRKLADLGTLCLNTLVTALNPNYEITVTTRPTSIQPKAFDLLAIPVPSPSMRAESRTQ